MAYRRRFRSYSRRRGSVGRFRRRYGTRRPIRRRARGRRGLRRRYMQLGFRM